MQALRGRARSERDERQGHHDYRRDRGSTGRVAEGGGRDPRGAAHLGAPVTDEQGNVLGVVSEADSLQGARAEPSRSRLAWLLDPYVLEGQLKLEARTAEEAMTAPARTIGPDRPVSEAAAEMIEAGVNRLPVVDEGKLVGIVTRADLVRAFTRSDAEIAREIREDIVLRTLWIVPDTVKVTVERGEVTLGGQVDTNADAELLPAFAGRVPGVVSVRSQLTWRDEDRRRSA